MRIRTIVLVAFAALAACAGAVAEELGPAAVPAAPEPLRAVLEPALPAPPAAAELESLLAGLAAERAALAVEREGLGIPALRCLEGLGGTIVALGCGGYLAVMAALDNGLTLSTVAVGLAGAGGCYLAWDGFSNAARAGRLRRSLRLLDREIEQARAAAASRER